MKYRSSRGGVSGLSFEDALFSGFLADGGIVMPETIPTISREILSSWSHLSYTELAKKVLSYFISEEEIPVNELNSLLDKAFSRFTHPETAPVVKLPSGLNVMELFHGVTWSFKDLALSCVAQFLEYYLCRRKQHVTIVVATSGDTGGAAIESVRGLGWVDIIVMFPRDRLSEVQEKQMTGVEEDNVHVIRVEGNCDDCDNAIKPCFMDSEFAARHRLCSINSINWSRLMVQIVHYVYVYLQLCPSCDEEVEVIVPTGACGNVTSGILAREMGVPVKLACAVTRNNIVHRTVSCGDFSAAEEVFATLAPAMDIMVPYNMERIWYLVSGGDSEMVGKLMQEFDLNQRITVPKKLGEMMRERITSTSTVTDEQVKETMRRVSEENNGYMVCPHTAIGVHHLHHKPATAPLRAVLGTASVCKFEGAVHAAGMTIPHSSLVEELLQRTTACVDLKKGEDWEQFLRQKIEEIWTKRR